MINPAAITGQFGTFYGIKVFLNPHLLTREQYRYPRSKRKRIRNKWTKQETNYRTIPSRDIIRTSTCIFVHPDTWREVQRKLKDNTQ